MKQEEHSPGIGLDTLRDALQAQVSTGEDLPGIRIEDIYASDLMSDVLAFGKAGSCLLTGLNSVQAAISSYMAEFKAIVFLRGKSPGDDICKFAESKGIALLSTRLDMYEACIAIARISGQLPTAAPHPPEKEEEEISTHDFEVDGSDFASAGLVSTTIKSVLKEIGYDLQLVRRVAISMYEGEMNVVMHAKRAKVTLAAGEKEIKVTVDDEGKGIPDIRKAMQKGFSTATEEQRAMGFGAGMGLPNISKNADHLDIKSEVDKGTKLEMMFNVK